VGRGSQAGVVALGGRRAAGLGELTTGVLGFVKFGARKWKQEEINTLERSPLFLLNSKPASQPKKSFVIWPSTTTSPACTTVGRWLRTFPKGSLRGAPGPSPFCISTWTG